MRRLLIALLLMLAPAGAAAHPSDVAVAELAFEGTAAVVELTLPRAVDFSPGAVVVLDGRGTAGRLLSQVDVPERMPVPKHRALRLRYEWDRRAPGGEIRYELFDGLSNAASCLVTVREDGKTSTSVLTPLQRSYSWNAPAPGAVAFMGLGTRHILEGPDHVLFLVSLLLAGGGLGYLVRVCTAFTVAHSVTLTLAVLGLVWVPARLIEVFIALSIVYVAAENLRGRAGGPSVAIVFGFGLMHGMGFAEVLRQMAIPTGSLAVSLATFNLGVEIGQMLIVGSLWWLLRATRDWSWQPRLRTAVSLGVVAAGLYWVVERALG